MTEIQWLCDMLLNFKMPKEAKERFIARIGEVEANISKPQAIRPMVNRPIVTGPVQSPSMQKILEAVEMEGGLPIPVQTEVPHGTPIAQTPMAAQALQARAAAIQQAASGKPEPGRTSPRKF